MELLRNRRSCPLVLNSIDKLTTAKFLCPVKASFSALDTQQAASWDPYLDIQEAAQGLTLH